jgi:serine/threonine-protein kinase
LRINSRPWAEVSIDGRPVGNTPLMNLTLSAGAHRVRLRNPQFGLEKTIKVQIVAGDVQTKVVDLQ